MQGWMEAVLGSRGGDPQRVREIARLLSQGFWTHDHPLMATELEQLGLPVRVGAPAEGRALMDLYPQPRGRETGVEYVPGRPLPPGLPPGRDVPRRRREARHRGRDSTLRSAP